MKLVFREFLLYNYSMFRLILSYFIWHYTVALKDFFNLSKNFLWFIFHFFSISVLLKTLFSPWQKLDESYKRGFNLNAIFETFVVNVLMRIVGFFIRITMIVVGTLTWIITLATSIVTFMVWIFLPFVITILFISGIKLLL